MQGQTGILLINTGSPDQPNRQAVYRYLLQFLLDRRIIDLPFLTRNLLVRAVIVPFRAGKSAEAYRQIWTEKGSPLIVNTEKFVSKLQTTLGSKYIISYAMRYGNPSIESKLEELKKKNPEQIIILPLFPQYASATTGSIFEEVMDIIRYWESYPRMVYINQFFDHPGYLEAVIESGKKYHPETWDHVLFSFHGLPVRQILKADQNGVCYSSKDCCERITNLNRLCYRAQCIATAREVARGLGLQPDQYTITFQSRLGSDEWIKPYTDEVIHSLAEQGMKKILVFSPAFVADCLETLYEIGIEYASAFRNAGGEQLQLVESLNDNDKWVATVAEIIKSYP